MTRLQDACRGGVWPFVLFLSLMMLALGQDLAPPPEVGLSLDAPPPPASSNLLSSPSKLSEVVGESTNRPDAEFAEPLGAWSKPPPKQAVMEDLQAPSDDEHGAPRSSSNMLPLVLVGAAGLLLVLVLVLGFVGRRYNRRFED